VTGPRLWLAESRPAEPAGFVRAFVETSDAASPMRDAVVVSFGDGSWIFLDADGRPGTTNWVTLLSLVDAVVEFSPDVHCTAAWAGPDDWSWMPEGERPFRCVWPSPHPGPHLIRGLIWLPGSEGEVTIDA
jgi:hypothetical protein